MKRFFLSFFLLFLFIPRGVFASEEFATNFNISYEVLSTGKINVAQEISLTNKLSNIYATQYSLKLIKGEVENIRAWDELGPLKTEIKNNNEETTIVINFNQQVVGKDKVLKFNLSYTALNLAQKNGQIWEINIPRLGEQETVDNYSLILSVPKSFGKKAYIRPEPVEQKETENQNVFRFTKQQVSSSGINAAFGEFQVFDFSLFYHLENPNSFLGETQIALPPDTAFQKINYQKIQPLPQNVSVDNDGNWLAKYILKPEEKITVSVKGKVKIFNQPQENFPSPSKENLQNNLLAQKYWEVDNPAIFQKAQELKTPRAIYDFVVKTLDYNYERVRENPERIGALRALEEPNMAICMEFTDLFIALSRAAGTPARELNGFAYTTNEKLNPQGVSADVLHSWPEYYDDERKIWVPIDPTWEKTTEGIDYFSQVDLNHFVFVIHGEDSETPYPPGSYKKEENIAKDVWVEFGEYEEEKDSQLNVDFSLPSKVYLGLKTKGKIVVENLGPVAVYNFKPEIKQEGVILNYSSSDFNINVFPPFAKKEVTVELKAKNFSQGNITVFLNNNQFNYPIKIGLPWNELIPPFLGIILLVGLLIFLTKRKFYVRKS